MTNQANPSIHPNQPNQPDNNPNTNHTNSPNQSTSDIIRSERGMTTKRRFTDGVKNFFTYLSTGLSVFVLGAVFVFVFTRGWSTLNWHMITGDYWSGNYKAGFTIQEPGNFTAPDNLEEGAVFSTKYGFAVKDDKNHEKKDIMPLLYVDPNSPLASSINLASGDQKDQPLVPDINSQIKKITYTNAEGKSTTAGLLGKQNAEAMINTLDNESQGIVSVDYQSAGGGIRGSLIATLMLIGITVVIALPIGVFAAIYLHEIAGKSKLTNAIRSAIEMLNGVPSIVFGLMGMTVFFPFTALFGATTPNILLGGLTMAVVLLPVVIRQTEEALITVPDKLRMGSLSLGATKTQTIFKVVLPNALPGILSATLLSISRVIGESAALIYTMGTFVVDDPKLNGRATTLAVQIWSVMSGEQPNFELASAISILILTMVLILNIAVKLITTNLNKKWKE